MGTPKQTLKKRPVATNATETETETKTAWNQGTGMQPSAASWRAPPRGEAPRWPKRRVRPSGSSNNNTEDQRVNHQARGNPATTKRPNKYKRELCNTWTETGTCPYGQRCQYAHGEAELRVEEADKPSAYKTVRCRNFWEKGSCPYGKRCRFVHDEAVGFDDDKAKRVKRHPKYKTKICTTFTETGRCPYGDKCAFIHQRKEDNMDVHDDVNDMLPLHCPVVRSNPANNEFSLGSLAPAVDYNLMPPQALHERSASQTFEQDQYSLYVQPYLPGGQTKMSVEEVALMSTDSNGIGSFLGGNAGIPLARLSTSEFEHQSRLSTWTR